VTTRRELREAREAAERARRKGVVGRIGSSSAKATRAARSAGSSLASRTGLRERRKQQEREETRGLRRVAVVLAAVAAVVLAAWFAVNQLGGSDETPAVAARTQRVVLLQVTGADGAGVGNALIAYDDGSGGDGVVLIPAGLTVAGSGAEPESLGQAAAKDADGKRARDELAKLLGVTIDGSFLLDPSALAALVDISGGVTVDVPTKITASGVTIPQGKQSLDGPSAAAYVTFIGRGEAETDRMDRLEAVLQALVPTFPRNPSSAAALPAALGQGMRSSLPDEHLGAVLAGLARTDGLRYERLPASAAEAAGGGATSYAIDPEQADRLMADLLGASRTTG
jgi:hypothetical protein